MSNDIKTKEDFLGNTYTVGDKVLYAGMSGRSVNMVLAVVKDIKDNGNVIVEGVKSARWKQHSGRTRYIDTRTGKPFDLWADKNYENATKVHSSVLDKRTGLELTDMQCQSHIRNPLSNRYEENPDYVPSELREYRPREFHDWLKAETIASKVTLTVTENIVKWTGPDAG